MTIDTTQSKKKSAIITRFKYFGCISFVLLGLWACEKKHTSTNAQQHLNSAQRYFQQGQIQAAMIEAQNALQAESNNVAAHQLMGQALLQSGAAQTAIDQYQQALKLTPDPNSREYAISENLLASAYLQLGDLEQAQALLKKESFDAETQLMRQLLRAELALAQLQMQSENESTTLTVPAPLTASIIIKNLQALLKTAIAQNVSPKINAQLHILIAQAQLLDTTLTNTERYSATQTALTAALAADEKSSDALIWQGHLRLAQHQYAEAENSYAKALLQLNRYDVMVHARFLALQGMIKALVGQNKTNEALHFNQLMAASPQGKLFQAYQNVLAEFQSSQYTTTQHNTQEHANLSSDTISQATQALQKIVRSAPNFTPAQTSLGILTFSQGDYAAAENHLLKSLNHNINFNAYMLTALAQWQQGKITQMIPLLEQALDQNLTANDQQDLRALLGLAYLHEGQINASYQTLIKAEQQQPGHRATQFALAQWEQQQQQFQQAQARYWRLLEKSMASTPAKDQLLIYQQLASLETAQGKSAVSYLQQLPQQLSKPLRQKQLPPPSDSARQIVLLSALLQEKNWPAADAHAQQLLQNFPHESSVNGAVAAAYFLLAQHYSDAEPKIALSYLDRSIERLPENPATYALQARIIEQTSGFDAALSQLQNRQKKQPQLLALHQIIGDLYARNHQPELAIAAYQNALQPKINALSTQLALAQLEWQLEQNDAAIARYESILAKQPDQTEVLNNLAWLYIDKNLDKAQLLAQRAYQLDSNDYRILDTYAWILLQRNQPAAAVPLLKRALREKPDDPTIKQHYAEALERSEPITKTR